MAKLIGNAPNQVPTNADLGKMAFEDKVSVANINATGTKDATTFLRGDNTFAEVPAGGIIEADVYRMAISERTVSNTAETLDDWERVDDTTFSKIGDGVSHSAGVFTFPRTGIYLVKLFMTFDSAGSSSTYCGGYIQTTNDNSTYVDDAFGTDRIESSTNSRACIACETLVDVTDTSNVKVRIRTFTQAAVDVYGYTEASTTSVSFIRLGDT